VYISEHPLTQLSDTIARVVSAYSNQLSEADHNRQVTMAGIVTSVRRHTTKSGKAMAFAGIEDLYGQMEVIIWPSTWDETQDLWQPDRVLLLRGKIDAERGEPKLLCDTATANFDVFEPISEDGPGASAPRQTNSSSVEPPSNFENLAGLNLAPEILEPDAPAEPVQEASSALMPANQGDQPAVSAQRVGSEQADPPDPAPAGSDPDEDGSNGGGQPQARSAHQHIRVQTQRSGDSERDKRSLQRIYGTLVSQPGQDTFSIAVADGEEVVELDFPNDTTCYSPELLAKLGRIVSADAIQVSPAQR
jgi:DNA polymerase-3 subunit alpha